VGLVAKESFTTYSRVKHDTLVLVLSAAYRDQLRFRTWWFPIVGSVPYKGFFDASAARAAARQLERDGFDAYLRPAGAFSTLGFFNDPLLSTTLAEDSAGLANTVIHELTHNTFYAPGQAVFNESFANFVGTHGAEWFFTTRGDTANAGEERRDWAREKLLGRFWQGVYEAVDSAFKAHPGEDSTSVRARLAARDTLFARARAAFEHDVLPQLPGYRPGMHVNLVLDNASLLARRVYRTGLDDFDGVYLREGSDLRRAIARIIALAKSEPKDPYAAIRTWLASPTEPAAQ
jgi:predicted aminopeptidase